jgi:hypothetical protein
MRDVRFGLRRSGAARHQKHTRKRGDVGCKLTDIPKKHGEYFATKVVAHKQLIGICAEELT